jgi:hypothetical protein
MPVAQVPDIQKVQEIRTFVAMPPRFCVRREKLL